MKRIKSSLGFALLLTTTVAADPAINLHNNNVGPNVLGRKIENLQYGVADEVTRVRRARRGLDIPAAGELGNIDLSAKVAKNQAVDVNSLLNGVSQDQSQGGPPLDVPSLLNGQGAGQRQKNSQTQGKVSGQSQVLGQSTSELDMGSLAGGQQQGAAQPIDASAFHDGLASGQQGGNTLASSLSGSEQGQPGGLHQKESQGAAGLLGGEKSEPGTVAQGIDANSINSLTGSQQGGNSRANSTLASGEGKANGQSQSQGQSAHLGALPSKQAQQQNGAGDGLDAAGILKSLSAQEQSQTQGKGQGDSRSQAKGAGDSPDDIAASIANQLLGEQSNSVDSILQGLNGGQNGGNRGQGGRNNQGNGVEIVEVKESIIQSMAKETDKAAEGQNTTVSFSILGSTAATDEKTKSYAPGTITEVAEGGKSTAAAEVKTTTSVPGTITEVAEAGNATSTASAKGAESATKASSPVIVVAGGGEGGGGAAQAASNKTTSATTAAMKSATLTPYGLVAPTTTSKAAGSVIVLAGTGSAGNQTIAKGGGAAIAVTVVANNGTRAGAEAQTTSSFKGTAINSATLTNDGLVGTSTTQMAGAVATVIAGGGSGSNGTAAAQAAGGACICACMCPLGLFPMAAPQAQPFQLGPMSDAGAAAASSPSTLQTQASASQGPVTVVAGGEPPANAPQAAATSSSAASINSANLTPAGLVGMSTTSAVGTAATVSASTVEGTGSSSALAATEASSSAPAATEASSSAPAATQASSSASTTAGGEATSATLQQNRLPFDISSFQLQSKVTVNLGARAAKETGAARRRWI